MNKFVKEAIEFANKYHTRAGQFRIIEDGSHVPYIVHIENIIDLLEEEAGISDDEVLIVAALHDVLEDTDCTREDMEIKFGLDITEAVTYLTRNDSEDFDSYTRKLFACEKYPYLANIKFADRIDNLRFGLFKFDNLKIKRKLEETYRCIRPFNKNVHPRLIELLEEECLKTIEYLKDEGFNEFDIEK